MSFSTLTIGESRSYHCFGSQQSAGTAAVDCRCRCCIVQPGLFAVALLLVALNKRSDLEQKEWTKQKMKEICT